MYDETKFKLVRRLVAYFNRNKALENASKNYNRIKLIHLCCIYCLTQRGRKNSSHICHGCSHRRSRHRWQTCFVSRTFRGDVRVKDARVYIGRYSDVCHHRPGWLLELQHDKRQLENKAKHASWRTSAVFKLMNNCQVETSN